MGGSYLAPVPGGSFLALAPALTRVMPPRVWAVVCNRLPGRVDICPFSALFRAFKGKTSAKRIFARFGVKVSKMPQKGRVSFGAAPAGAIVTDESKHFDTNLFDF